MDHPIKRLRNSLNLSQTDFAKSIGVTAGRISQVEAGAVGDRLGGETMLELADVYRDELARLGLTVEDLLRGHRGAA